MAKGAAGAEARPSPLWKANPTSQLSELPPYNHGIADSAILFRLPQDVLEHSLSTLGKRLLRLPLYTSTNRYTGPFAGTALPVLCGQARGFGYTQQLFWSPRELLGSRERACSVSHPWAGRDPCYPLPCPVPQAAPRLWSELSAEKGSGER